MKRSIFSIAISILIALTVSMTGYAGEYQHKLEAESMTFSWSINGDTISIELTAETTSWVGIGFDPENAMEGANIIIGAVKNGKAKIEDHYGDRKRNHSSDEKLGGTNDVIDPSGSEENGVTTLTFAIPLKTEDKYDKPIVTDAPMKVMLAHGKGRDSFKSRHPYRSVYEINLSTGESKQIK